MQLELFPKPYDEEIEDLKERYERLRKSQHARISGLQKDIKELKSEVEFLKANICKGLLL
jgi:chaperonin cofactor prefoldin